MRSDAGKLLASNAHGQAKSQNHSWNSKNPGQKPLNPIGSELRVPINLGGLDGGAKPVAPPCHGLDEPWLAGVVP